SAACALARRPMRCCGRASASPICSTDDRELDDLVARADAALYAAKREGKNRVTVSRAAA
ncbi:hypothetical protein ACFSUK_03810, partial [Sphingobium scionense]